MIDYEEEWLLPLLFKREGSVAHRAVLFAVPASILSVLLIMLDDWAPGFREGSGLSQASGSQLWAATTAVLAALVSFRTNKAYSRFWEGTSLLHQMRGEWFDSVSCCVTFSRSAKSEKCEDVENFRHTIVRLMSLCHGSALEEIAGIDRGQLNAIDVLGLDNKTLKHLNDCSAVHEFNRVEVLLHLTQSLIVKSLDAGLLRIAPPILSRVFQTLSRGFVNLLNCKKITDTRFPFPYAQVIAMLLFFHATLTPLLISNVFTGSTWSKIWAPIFTFMPVFGLHSLNAVAIELENPFGDDDNDLPLDHFQDEMNSCLMMLLQDDADLIPGVKKTCTKNYSDLKQKLLEAEDPAEEIEVPEPEEAADDGSPMSPLHRRSAKHLSLRTTRSFVISEEALDEEEEEGGEEEEERKEEEDAKKAAEEAKKAEEAKAAAEAAPAPTEVPEPAAEPHLSNRSPGRLLSPAASALKAPPLAAVNATHPTSSSNGVINGASSEQASPTKAKATMASYNTGGMRQMMVNGVDKMPSLEMYPGSGSGQHDTNVKDVDVDVDDSVIVTIVEGPTNGTRNEVYHDAATAAPTKSAAPSLALNVNGGTSGPAV
eukprot:TRINITY_DN2142_c0_g4_i1.p1 TRINITY_DN2142_c0_g4~~TRINITY_DN2142_c0_g4_i1.p1  ORF type:complete len:597 (-),score=173.76 TRINITY_DN2142_c0_g4_i1:137-1927(-)